MAVAALRSAGVRQVRADDHAAVLKISSKRHRDLARLRNQAAGRLHAVLCELIPGGVSKAITATAAARLLGPIRPAGGRGRSPLRARRGLPGGPARHRRPDPRDQEEAHRRRVGGRDEPDRAGSHPRHRLFGQATPGPRHHPTTAASNLAPGPARHLRSGPIALQPAGAWGRAGHSSTAAILPSAKPQVQVETAPATKRGRRTWRRGETTATLGHEEGQGPRFAGEPTAPEGRHTPAKRPTEPLDTRRLSLWAALGCGLQTPGERP